MNTEFEVAIIGAGPIGLSCAIEAKKRNISHIVIEKGCLVNSIFHYPINMTFFSTSDKIEIGDVPFVSHGDKPTRREALDYFRRVKHSWKLNIHTYERAEDIRNNNSKFLIQTDKGFYEAANVIIATGFYDKPNLLHVPGEELPKVFHYFVEAHPYADQKIAVIGAGNSAVDVALELYRKGADVTMIIREEKIKDSVKYWVKPDIENRIKENSIRAYFRSEVLEIGKDCVKLRTPVGILDIANDFVFAMTGYHSDFDFLEKIGITADRTEGPVFNPDTFETNIKGMYLAGVVCSGYDTARWFIENSLDHAVKIFNCIQNSAGKN